MRRITFAVAILLLMSTSAFAGGGDLSTAIDIMASGLPAGADVAGMGNASTAQPDFSSNNPATLGAVPNLEKFTASGTATYGRINFQGGPLFAGQTPDTTIKSGSVSAKIGKGVAQLNYTHASANEISELYLYDGGGWGQSFQINRDESVSVLYGIKIADEWSIGLGYARSESHVTSSFYAGTMATGYVLDFEDKAEGDSYSAGVLYQPTSWLNLGAEYEYTREVDEMIQKNYGGYAMDDTSHSQRARGGASIKITPMTTLAADLQYYKIAGEVEKLQLFAGIEQGVIKDVAYLYAGWANSGPTVGLGVYLEHGGINLAYQRNVSDEMAEYFGRADLLIGSLYLTF